MNDIEKILEDLENYAKTKNAKDMANLFKRYTAEIDANEYFMELQTVYTNCYHGTQYHFDLRITMSKCRFLICTHTPHGALQDIYEYSYGEVHVCEKEAFEKVVNRHARLFEMIHEELRQA